MEHIDMGMSGYFQSLERLLDCPKSLRRSFLSQTRRMAEDFVQGKPDATQKDLVNYLGEPKELAQGFLETLDPEALERYRKHRKLLFRGCVAALAVALVCAGALCVYFWRITPNVEITETIIIYPECTEGI